MNDESRESDRPDFDERLREVTRKRQGRRRDVGELEEDGLFLSGREDSVFAPKGRGASDLAGDGRLLWLAVGLGGVALVVALIGGALWYRLDHRIDGLAETVTFLEEQAEAAADPRRTEGDLRVDLAQLSTRVDALDRRLAELEQKQETGGGEIVAELRADMDRLNRALTAIQPRLVKLEQQVAQFKPSRSKPGTSGWYVVLASLGTRQAAEKLHQRYHRQGVQAEIHAVTVKGKRWYRLRVGPFAGQKAAARRAEELKRKLHLASVWLSR